MANKNYKRNTNRSENLNYKFRRNDYIRTSEIRVIDENGEQLGVMKTYDALRLARERELDLVEVAAQAVPPVCRIISWSKFKYEYSKKHKSTKNTGTQVKEMWFKPLIDGGDLAHKVKKVREFLDEKHKVKLTVKGNRQTMRLDRQIFFNLLQKIITDLGEEAIVETPPKLEGKNVYAIIKSSKK